MATAERQREYRKLLKQRAFTSIGDACVFCGKDEELHAAHVKPTGLNGHGRGMERRFLDVLKHPDAYRPMCKACHQTFDALAKLVKEDEVVPF